MFAIVAQAAADVPPPAYSHLRCDGVATRRGTESTSTSFLGTDGVTHNADSERAVARSRRAMIRFDFTGQGRIQFGDRWQPLTSFQVADDRIIGRYKSGAVLNPFAYVNQPDFRIDRVNGQVRVSDYGFSFDGVCKPETSERAF